MAIRFQGSFGRRGLLSVVAWIIAAPALMAADPVAHPVPSDGPPALLVREAPDKPWRFIRDKEPINAGTEVLGGLGAAIESTDAAVIARFTGNIAKLSPFPIMETSIILRDPTDADFAFEMTRGRIDLINHKKAGAAKVRVAIRNKTADIALTEPGTRLVIEMYGRWPKGVRFNKKPKEGEGPALALVLIAAHGVVQIKGPERALTLSAPPGPALLFIDSFGDEMPEVQQLETLPDWVDHKDDEQLNKVRANVKAFRDLAAKSTIGDALLEMALSDSEPARHMAVTLLGALDDLSHLGAAMMRSTHPDVRQNGILVLRHWIGRGPGQDLKLYQALIEKAGFKPGEAEVALQLLHSFSDADLQRPETYETLIGELESDKPLIGALAHWHLVRLVHAGRKIEYNPKGTKEEKAAAAKAWQEIIPPGTLPRHQPTAKDEKE